MVYSWQRLQHATKVGWLYSHTMNSDALLDHDNTPNTFNYPPKIDMEDPNLNIDVNITIMVDNNVYRNVEELQMTREDLFGYIDLLRNSPPPTSTMTKKLIGLFTKMLDDVNDLHIMGYEFTLALGAYESSLKTRKSFLNLKKKNKRGKQSGILEIDLNVPASNYEPFQFQHLNK